MKTINCLLILTVVITTSRAADAGVYRQKCKPVGCCDSVECLPCNMVCCPEVKTIKVEKHCWETECKPVCIPKVPCPLFSFFRKDACDPCTDRFFCGIPLKSRCADVRMVKKLKKVAYECDKCVCEWKIQSVPCIGKGCDYHGSPDSCCPIR